MLHPAAHRTLAVGLSLLFVIGLTLTFGPALRYLPAHLFTLALVTLVPAASAAALRILLDEDGRLRIPRTEVYREVIASQLLLAGFALLVLIPFGNPFERTGLTEQAWIGAQVLIAIVLAAFVAEPVWHDAPPGRRVSRSIERVSFLLPRSRRERRWWIALSLAAGVCEELVFRGFLIHYLQTHLPGIGLAGAVVASSVAFGLGHLYQGVRSAALTAAVGAALALAFVATGSLWAPIVLHALLDLRILFIRLPREPDVAPEVP